MANSVQCGDHAIRMRVLEELVRQLVATDARQEERHGAVLGKLDELAGGVRALQISSAQHEASLVVLVGDRERRKRVTKRALTLALGGIAATITAACAKFGDVVFAQLTGR